MEVKAFKGVIKFKVSIIAKTGLHIGGAKENIEIGGIDNIVEKLKVFKPKDIAWNPEPEWEKDKEFYDVPYIPGSSLKGKLRSLAEWSLERPVRNFEKELQTLRSRERNEEVAKNKALNKAGNPCYCGECLVCRIFGTHQAQNIKEPVRLRVEDFYPSKETIKLWEKVLEGGYTEIKVENMIDRIRGTAQHPRHMERVIAGSVFEGYITLRIFEEDNVEEFLKLLKTSFELLEDDYLGGNGSRGYGRVKIKVSEIKHKVLENGEYKVKDSSEILELAQETFKAFLKEGEGTNA